MKRKLPSHITVLRAQTQKNVNHTILTDLYNQFPSDTKVSFLDLPCGGLEFLKHVKALFPDSDLTGADLMQPSETENIQFYEMDLTREFTLPTEKKYDVVSSIAGVMMFSNTLSFIKNCSEKLKDGGTFILTNDNNATIKDRLAYLFLGRYRLFNLVFEDNQALTENVPINELVRLLRTNRIRIDDIQYTSFYIKDVIFLPFAVIAYVSQWLYLKILKTRLPEELIGKMYPFNHLFCRHYIIKGTKVK